MVVDFSIPMRRFSVKWFSRYFIVYEPKICKMLFTAQHAIARSNEPCMHSWNLMLVQSTLIPFCMTLSLLTWRYSPICNELSISFFLQAKIPNKNSVVYKFSWMFSWKSPECSSYIGKAIHASLYTLINEHAKSGFRGISLFMNQKQAKRFSPHIKCQGRRNIFYSGGGGYI